MHAVFLIATVASVVSAQLTTVVPPDCSTSSQGWLGCMSTVASQNDECDKGTDLSPCVCNFYFSQSSCFKSYCGTDAPELTILASQVAVACSTTDVAPNAAPTDSTMTPAAAGSTVSASGSNPTTTKTATSGPQATSTNPSATPSTTAGTKNAAPAERLSGAGLGIALVAIAGSLGLYAYL